MKKVLAILLVVMTLFALCACGKKATYPDVENKLQGEWQSELGTYVFKTGRFTCETVIMGISLGEKAGSYTIDEDSINLAYDGGVEAELEYVIDGGTLVIYMDDETKLVKSK